MLNLIVLICVQIVAAFFLSLIHAWVLRGYAIKKINWEIKYKNAYLMSLASWLTAIIFADAIMYLISLAYQGNDDLFKSANQLAIIVVWWIVHSALLFKIPNSPNGMTNARAREISAAVFARILGWSILILGYIGMLAVIISKLI